MTAKITFYLRSSCKCVFQNYSFPKLIGHTIVFFRLKQNAGGGDTNDVVEGF